MALGVSGRPTHVGNTGIMSFRRPLSPPFRTRLKPLIRKTQPYAQR